MTKQRILIVEDDENIQELISYNLEKEGWDVECHSDGQQGLKAALESRPDLILLDIMLPELDGLSVCREIKRDQQASQIPIIMLTAKGEEADIVVGLEMGADDYITKPFSPRILAARCRAALRRPRTAQAEVSAESEQKAISIHGLTIHPGRREVVFEGQKLDLTETEFRLLHFLSRRPGWVFTRNQILDAVRGEDAIVTDRAVDVQVVGLRKKLGVAGELIETVRGVGYRFREK